MTTNPDWNKAERLIVRYARQFIGDISFLDRTLQDVIQHGRRLIVECEPKLMSSAARAATIQSALGTSIANGGYTGEHGGTGGSGSIGGGAGMPMVTAACAIKADRKDIFDVLDGKMAALTAQSLIDLCTLRECRRILAEVLKEKV